MMSPARAAGPSLRTASSHIFLSQVPFSSNGKALRELGRMILAVAYSAASPRTNSRRWSWLSFLVSPCSVTARKATKTTGDMRETAISITSPRNQLLQYEKQRHHDRSGEQAAFHTIAAAAPEHSHVPLQGVPGYTHCKPAQVASEQGKSHVPAKMQTDREPQRSSTPHCVPQQDS